MARLPRLYLPNTAQLVMVRGINSAPVFLSDVDYQQWHNILRSIVPNYAVAIHAYALLEDSLYLLVSADEPAALGKLMQDLGRRYVRYFNQLHGRTGTLWEGRYRTAYLQDAYILSAYLWLDSMSQQSSRNHHEGMQTLGFITEHPQYWALGNTPFDRQHQYRQSMLHGLNPQVATELAQAVKTGWALGDIAFLSHAARIGGRRVTQAARGRPKKAL
ncbi:MAG: transposase [Formosimonas sp.]